MDVWEELAVLTALQKAVKARLDEVRTEADMNMGDGIEKRTLSVGGKKVGQITVSFSKEDWVIEDREAFESFALDYGMARIEKTISPEWMETCVKALESTFEPDVLESAIEEKVVLDGDWKKAVTKVGSDPTYLDSGMVIPGLRYKPSAEAGTRVTGCKPSDVIPVLQGLPGGMERALLGGADG